MRNLLLICALGAAGYLGYSYCFTEPPPPPAPPPAPAPSKIKPVDWQVKMRVRRILEEWKRITLKSSGVGSSGPTMVSIREEFSEIRKHLFPKGAYDEEALNQVMRQAARELGYSPDQAETLVSGALGASGK